MTDFATSFDFFPFKHNRCNCRQRRSWFQNYLTMNLVHNTRRISAYALKLISNESRDINTANVCTIAAYALLISNESRDINTAISMGKIADRSKIMHTVNYVLVISKSLWTWKWEKFLSLNIRDVFVRLLSHSVPHLSSYRRILVCKRCGEIGHIRKEKCKGNIIPLLDQDKLVDSLLFKKTYIV